MAKGYVHIYCGDGKGKTTAAVGLAVRAASSGRMVVFYQFMKDNTSGERSILKYIPEIEVIDGLTEEKFSFAMSEEEKEERRDFYHNKFLEASALAEKQDNSVLILDEIVYTIKAGLFDQQILLDYIRNRPEGMEIVLTGNPPDGELCEAADYVSEIMKRKHPFDQGEKARKGIEF